MLKSPLWFIYSNGNTNHSTHVTITTIYFVKLLLKIILSTFTTSAGLHMHSPKDKSEKVLEACSNVERAGMPLFLFRISQRLKKWYAGSQADAAINPPKTNIPLPNSSTK
jgi:hypothetical protein